MSKFIKTNSKTKFYEVPNQSLYPQGMRDKSQY